MNLKEIFRNAPDLQIEQLSTDSRLPMRNAIFFCLDGIKYDGHDFIHQAIENGAKVIVYSKEITNKENAIYIRVKDVSNTLSKIAEVFYNHPNRGITKYVISGCYGRSSVSSIISYFLNTVSSCGSVGTFGINYKDKHLDISFPALTPLENLKTLDNLKKSNVKNAVFETSAISLYYKKLDVVKPDVFVYTNTSKYCSDYKVCNNYYFENIRRYLYTLEDTTCVLLNGDDESFNELKDCVNNYLTYGHSAFCNYRISKVLLGRGSSQFKFVYDNNSYTVNTRLLGLQNIYNLTAAIAALHIKGYEIKDIIDVLEKFECVDGVMELINPSYHIIVDCGYEIDSIINDLKYAKTTSKGRIITIMGINYSDNEERLNNLCEALEEYSDVVILTEDESLQAEVSNILSRTDKYISSNKVVNISYRSIAIENAINIMNKNDTLLILGKGNEKYLSMGLGKEKYLGDKYYALKYIKRKEEEMNETI